MPGFRIVPHTSEIGLALRGRTLKQLFRSAALGLLRVYGLRGPRARRLRTWRVRVRGLDGEELLVRWLNDLILFISARRRVYGRVGIGRLLAAEGDWVLEAELEGESLRPERHRLGREVKSATYHGLKILKAGEFFRAQVIFDV